jgi:hypothetical protein
MNRRLPHGIEINNLVNSGGLRSSRVILSLTLFQVLLEFSAIGTFPRFFCISLEMEAQGGSLYGVLWELWEANPGWFRVLSSVRRCRW